MAEWRLTDGRDPADGPEDFPTVLIGSEADLRRELARLRELPPGLVSLSSPTNGALQIGIGGPFAGIRWYEDPQKGRAVLADRLHCPTRLDFLAEGDTIAFWPENLMLVDQAIDIVVYFFHHLRLPDWVSWKEWDAVRNEWVIHPATAACSA